MTALTDPNDIEMFRLVTIRRYLKLEVDTGMRMRGNLTLRRAKEALEMYGYTPKRNRKDVLVQMDELLKPHDEYMEKEAGLDATNHGRAV